MQFSRIKQAGLTTLELIVTIAIAGIIIGLAIPSFDSFTANSKVAAANNSLVFSLQLARSEAVERLLPTGLCVSANPDIEEAVCAPGAGYESGWIVYVDANGNGVRDSGGVEEIINRNSALSGAFRVTADTAFEDQIYFNDSGNSVNVAGIPLSGVIEIDYADGSQVRELTVSANGRVSTKTAP